MLLTMLLMHLAFCLPTVLIAISQDSSQIMIDKMLASFQTSDLNFTDFNLIKLSQEDPIDGLILYYSIVIDVTYNLLLQVKLIEAAKMYYFIHIIVREPLENFSEWEFFSLLPMQAHYQALSSFLIYLNFYQYNLIYSDSVNSIKLRNLFYWDSNKKNQFCYSNNKNETTTDYFIGKEVKTTGLQNMIILNEGEGASKIIRSLVKNKIYTKNSGILLWSKSIWGVDQDGLIIIVQEGLEFVKSSEDYEIASVLNFLQKLNTMSESLWAIKNSLELESVNYRFSIVNIQHGERVIIGKISNGQVNIFKAPIFPGSTYDFPDSTNSKIKISISDGITNYDGAVHRGTWLIRIPTLYALNYANKTNFIKNFYIELHETDCSAEYYKHDFSYNCFLNQKDKFGVVFIPSIHDEVCLGTISDFREMDLKIPIVGDFCLSPDLNDQAQFPEFIRAIKGFELHSATMARMMRIFGWKNVVVMYENTTLGETLYKGFMTVADENGIKVVNDEDKRMVKASYSNKDLEEYKGYLTHAIQTNCRIFALFIFVDLSSHFYMASHLYDLGLRRGDAIFLFYQTVSWFPYYALGTEPEVIEKCKELYFGSLTFFQAEWIGDFGKQIYKDIENWFGQSPLSYQCHSFNTGWLVINALKSLVEFGEDYTDRDIFLKSVRKQKIMSCTGKLVMSLASNEPEEMVVGINNLIPNSTTGLWEDFPVGSYSIIRNPVLNFDQTITWSDGSTQIPSDMRVNSLNCPFTKKQIQENRDGKAIYYSVVGFLTFLGLAISMRSIMKYWKLAFPVIAEKREIKFRDWMAVFCLLIETLQLLALGPEFIYSKKFIVFDYISGNLANTTTYDSKIFWPGIYTALTVCLVMLIFNALVVCKIEEQGRSSFLAMPKEIAKELIPFISNLFFIPVINSLFSLFRCTKGISSSALDSFLYGDCNYWCWHDFHIVFAILASVSLLSFIPSTIIWRPYYETITLDKNIYCNEHYLIAKSILQLIAIALRAALGTYSNSLHGLFYILFLTTFLAYSIFYKPYNYSRINLWASISILSVIWSTVLSSIYSLVSSNSNFIWIPLLILGWICIIIAGYVFQEKFLPNFLYSVRGKDISLLFKFEFSTKILAEDVVDTNKHKYSVIDSSNRLEPSKSISLDRSFSLS